MINYRDTIGLIGVMERLKPAATFLLETFFPVKEAVLPTTKILVEYREGKRKLAPFITKGNGRNVKREGSYLEVFTPPMMGARRILSIEDIEQRGFGETVYSTMSPAQRAAEIQARDLVELQDMITNRKNKMAAEILTSGKCEIKGYADDNKIELVDEIEYEAWNGVIIPPVVWSTASAKIYSDIKNCCENIQEKTGMMADIMVCGKNIEKYLLANTEMKNWLMVPNAQNLALMSIQPKYIYPGIRRIGYLSALNLEIYSYTETYTDDDGSTKSFIGEDEVIIGVSGQGRQIHGAVTLVDDSEMSYATYAAEYVPQYAGSKKNQTLSLSMYSRCVLAPMWSDSWYCIKSCGQ